MPRSGSKENKKINIYYIYLFKFSQAPPALVEINEWSSLNNKKKKMETVKEWSSETNFKIVRIILRNKIFNGFKTNG
jgi:hypothetical protein